MLKKILGILTVICLMVFIMSAFTQIVTFAHSSDIQCEHADFEIRGPNDSIPNENHSKKSEELTDPKPPPMYHIHKHCCCIMCGYGCWDCNSSTHDTSQKENVSNINPDTTEAKTETEENETEADSDNGFTVKFKINNFKDTALDFMWDVLPYIKIHITYSLCKSDIKRLWQFLKRKLHFLEK